MPEHAIIIGKVMFDWKAGLEALGNLVDDDGEVCWRNAFSADPGVTKCPGCSKYYWKEADKLKCPTCNKEWEPFNNRQCG